jgi:hypothetical protein
MYRPTRGGSVCHWTGLLRVLPKLSDYTVLALFQPQVATQFKQERAGVQYEVFSRGPRLTRSED